MIYAVTSVWPADSDLNETNILTGFQAAPLMIFAFLGPIIRAKCPEGFVLTEWTRQRYGLVAALYLSLLTLVTMFLYMVAELSALQQIMNALTGMNGLPMVIVECAVTTIYTCKEYNA